MKTYSIRSNLEFIQSISHSANGMKIERELSYRDVGTRIFGTETAFKTMGNIVEKC